MNSNRQLDLALLRDVADRLQSAPRVVRMGGSPSDIEDIATEAASSLLQIQRACSVLYDELLPRLKQFRPESSEFADALDDIAEEYRLIHYQIVNTRVFNYVVPRDEQASPDGHFLG